MGTAVAAALVLAWTLATTRFESARGKDIVRGNAELEEMKEARREFYQGLILHKLNVTVPRDWSPQAVRRLLMEHLKLPESLLASHEFLPKDTPLDRKLDDFYAETKQYMLLALDASAECKLASPRQRLCMSFDLKSVSAGDTIVAAKLYVWTPEVSRAMGRRGAGAGVLQVRQLTQHLRPAAVVTESPAPRLDSGRRGAAAAAAASGNDSGWLFFELRKDAARSWLDARGDGSVRLELTCKDCESSPPSSGAAAAPLAVDFGERRPFILVDVERAASGQQSRRTKRQEDPKIGGGIKLYCDAIPAGQQACCIERLQVNFSDFYPYIMFPKSFYPNYCRGSCSGFGQQIAYTNTNIVRVKLQGKRSLYVPCCVPTRMASVDVLYMADDGRTVKMKAMPNMVVEQCGCM